MSEDHHDIESQSIAALFSGIVVDLQQLAEQQLQLAKSEVEDELHRRATSAKIYLCVIAILFIAGVNLSFALVHLLHGAPSAASSDSGGFALWSSHSIVACILFGFAGALTGLERLLRKNDKYASSESKKDSA